MKRPLRVTTMVVAAVALLAGVVIGFMPVKASITQLQPQLRLLSVACGNGYLQTTPPVLQGNLVQLSDEPGVYLPRDSYAQQCTNAVGWRRYGAWALTVVGVLGLAFTVAGANSRSGPRRPGPSGNAPSGRDVAARKRDGDDEDGPAASAGSRGAHRRSDG